MLMRSVYLSTASTLVIFAGYCTLMPGGGGLACVSIPHLTSSAVTSLPSWNFTPRRGLNQYVWPSALPHPAPPARPTPHFPPPAATSANRKPPPPLLLT